MYHTTKNAIFCADFVIIPSIPDFLGTAGLKRLVGFLHELRDQFLQHDNQPARIAGIVFNMFSKAKKSMKLQVDEIESYIEETKHTKKVFLKNAKVFHPPITNLDAIAKAHGQRLPVNMVFPTHDASTNFVLLTKDIIGVLNGING